MVIETLNILFWILTIGYVYFLLDFKNGWDRLPIYKSSNSTPSTHVTIVIAARNEENNIGKTLDAILNQNYPKNLMEVIVINDHSEDNTAKIVEQYFPFITLINFLDPTTINSYKKSAIAQAIKNAKGEVIITTDADCVMKVDWLRTMVDYYEQNSFKMISGPVVYHHERTLFERLQSLEFLFLIGMGASRIGNMRPITCNGANLLYDKTTFNEVGGFAGIDNKASGDDELLLHKVAKRYPNGIGFLKSIDAIVYTIPVPTLLGFIAQRKRWASKSTSYKDKRIIFLGVWMWLFNLSLLLSFIITLLYGNFQSLLLAQIGLKIAAELYFYTQLAMFANRTKLLILTPLLSILHVFYLIFIGIAGNIGKYEWKGRTVN